MGQLSQEVNLIVIASFFFLLIAVGIISLVMVYRRKQVEYIHEQSRMKAAFEKELLEAQLEVQEQTMKHIAQEIHDNIGGTLSLAKLNLNTISPEKLSSSTSKLANTKELVTKAISDLRTLSKTLHKEAVLSAGLTRAIEMELKLIDKAAVFQTFLTVTGETQPLDPQKELILFRTVQEALNNAIKHADATEIHVKMDFGPTGLWLAIGDNGKGFRVAEIEADPERGSGLRNMKNRTKLIGGKLTIAERQPGTEIQISLPIIAS
ncbi:MAG TPA: ATP-binding protein [Flavisolibacter sp.]|nr:ATP-binding protein [Flavisolibacter sp.]